MPAQSVPPAATILIVDDAPENLTILSGILREEYRVRVATNGEKALAIANSEDPPDLILLDVLMPGMTGHEVCRRLKANPQTSWIPIIFVTALEDAQDEKTGFDLGAADYITKPLRPIVVKARIKTQLALYQQERLLAQTNKELEKATQLKDEFLANMSHELRTPLNAILGMAEGLQEEVFGTLNVKQKKALQTIDRSGSHLLELINDILDLAKVESGKLELEYAPTKVKTICQQSLSFIKQQAHKKQIEVQLKIPDAVPELRVDERRIRQVLINLLTNAVKFTPEKGQFTVEVIYPSPANAIVIPSDSEAKQPGLSPSSPLLRIAVIDNGIGIHPVKAKQLFRPFVQIDNSLNRQNVGTGLGLALVKRIVEMHGGSVGLTSEEGKGSCFTIDLPCAISPIEEVSPPPLVSLTELSQTDLNLDHKAVILLVDDNESNLNTVSSYLTAKGYEIHVAKNGQEAIEKARSDSPDLILMDIQMPIMDGLEATQKIRQYPHLASTPIIALTALAMKEDKEKCLAAGANDYISKPVKLKQLAATIQQLLSTQP
ncbi:MAG: response regulator [Prochlorotrichaceae cyanobacterium]